MFDMLDRIEEHISKLPKSQKMLLTCHILLVFILGIAVGGMIEQIIHSPHKNESLTMRNSGSKKMALMTDKVEKDLWVTAEGQSVTPLKKSNGQLPRPEGRSL
jgi:hypothetical protein